MAFNVNLMYAACPLPAAFLSIEAQPMSSFSEVMLLLGLVVLGGQKPCIFMIASTFALSSGVLRRWVKSIARK